MYRHLCSGIYITCIKFKHNMCVAYFNGNGIWYHGYHCKQKNTKANLSLYMHKPKTRCVVCYFGMLYPGDVATYVMKRIWKEHISRL
jgi:hypothetical protein